MKRKYVLAVVVGLGFAMISGLCLAFVGLTGYVMELDEKVVFRLQPNDKYSDSLRAQAKELEGKIFVACMGKVFCDYGMLLALTGVTATVLVTFLGSRLQLGKHTMKHEPGGIRHTGQQPNSSPAE